MSQSSIKPRPMNLTAEEEESLEWELRYHWTMGTDAKGIAYQLDFGTKGTRWEKLNQRHVYYYRRKFNLVSRRQKKMGESRYKVAPGSIEPPTLEDFTERLDHVYPLNDPIPMFARKFNSFRVYLLLHYYSPLRKSEIYERLIEDFSILKNERYGDWLHIDLYRKKKRLLRTSEPFILPMFPHVMEIVTHLKDRLEETEDPTELLFPWGLDSGAGSRAWRICKGAFPEAYPHYWRFKYITDGLSDVDTPVGDLKVETGLSLLTLDRYAMTGTVQRTEATKRRMLRMSKDSAQTTRVPIQDLNLS